MTKDGVNILFNTSITSFKSVEEYPEDSVIATYVSNGESFGK
jgi:hypothetical protein